MASRKPGAPPLSRGGPSAPSRAASVRSLSTSSSATKLNASTGSSDQEAGSSRPSSPPKRMSTGVAAGMRPPQNGAGGMAVRRGGEEETNIKVAVRVRGRAPGEPAPTAPILSTSGPRCSQITVHMDAPPVSSHSSAPTSALVTAADAPREKTYNFDNVFGPEADQGMVYQTVVTPVLAEVLSGYNCTIFAYGQTGTGKTHTMEGDLTSQLGTYVSEAGIIPRTLYRLFHQLELSKDEYSVHASFVELYNEELRDLLSPDLPTPLTSGGLKVYDDKGKGVVIQGLEDTPMRDAAHGLELLRRGSQKRQIAATRCNENSSRSHSVFTLTVHTKETTAKGEDVLRVGKLNLVDLAGSENIGRSGAENKRAREAGMINQSLLTLGRVINALVEKSTHVPYRESKLTRLLQESLGGRTKTCIIATVSAEKSNLEETLSTLDYALRAKSIRNRPEMNSRMTRAGLIMEYVKDIERLKRDVLAARSKEGFFVSNESWKEVQDESDARKNAADELRRLVEVAESKRESLQEQFEQNMQLLLKRETEMKAVKTECAEKKLELDGVIDQAKELQVALAEETELREAYRNSEKKLNRIASSLKAQAEDDQSDLGGLFAKLERKTRVEEVNRGLIADYRDNVSTVTARLEQQASAFSKAHLEFSDDLASTLDAFVKQETVSLEQSQGQLVGQLDSLRGIVADLAQEHGLSQGVMDSLAARIGGACAQIREASQQQATALQEEWVKVQEQLNTSQINAASGAKKAMNSLQDAIGNMIQETRNHIAAEEERVDAVKAFATESAEREVATLREQNQLLTNLLEQERQKSVTAREKLTKNIADLLVGFTNERDADLSEAISSVQSNMTTSEVHAQQFVDGHHEKMEELRAASQTFSQAIEDREKTTRRHRKKGEAYITEAQGMFSEGVTAWSGTLEASLSGGAQSFDKLAEDVAAEVQQARGQAESSLATQAKQLEALSASAEQSSSSALSQLASTLANVDDLSARTQDRLTSHRQTSLTYLNEATARLSKMRGDTRTYLEDQYAEDVPTGETPQRKEATSSSAHQWKLVPGTRQKALEQYRYMVAKKQQSRAEEADRRTRGTSVALSEVDGTMGTLPDDTRATMDTTAQHDDSQQQGTDEEGVEEGEEGLDEDVLEDSIHFDSDDTVKLGGRGAAAELSAGPPRPVSSLKTRSVPASVRGRGAARAVSARSVLGEKNVTNEEIVTDGAKKVGMKGGAAKAPPAGLGRRTTRA
ncbi:kinesin-domain-containing protein [Microstroma glucosiphilum]|uniref:Kinesin-domain-containing protein n=1 Tax=Pseudomicrostroma glucosiphilum TaxID=1684307 RepID=A0A316UFV0_9BASI|nr:kinesin-domain-containing protein [Pseudomicrostroma glucosiphilum]PWN22783.1 kinesin-domain-containing protein [Pseudomicrostroma glucosiphilum]